VLLGRKKALIKNNNNFVQVSSLYLCDLQIIPKMPAVFLTITVMEGKKRRMKSDLIIEKKKP